MDINHFLEGVGLYDCKRVEVKTETYGRDLRSLSLPEINLYCDSKKCNGKRIFEYTGSHFGKIEISNGGKFNISYRCKNCREFFKIYSIIYKVVDNKILDVEKFGEYPSFGTRVPDSVLDLFGEGSDKKNFIKGRKSEDQGFGIGAFTYYRRVVENQKNRLIDKIIKVCRNKGMDEEDIKTFEDAKSEHSFKKSHDRIKDLIPESLFIKTHNPLTLLHNLLSIALHDKDDDYCLEQAKHIRGILTALVERIETLLKEDKSLNESLTALLKSKKEAKN
ncbi:MAG: hypothetical protein WD097_09515 [Balneolales bacterium]